MSQGDNFVSRWSRLKREWRSRRERDTEQRRSATPSGAAGPSAANEDTAAGTQTGATPTVNLASLPSIESITADTDISVFLQSGVPGKLTEAALRRAWVSDPVIRDFIGIAENQWDFTDPTAIPGFGPVQATGDKLSLVAQTAGIRDEIAATARETQAASAMCTLDSERSSAPPEDCSIETAAKNNGRLEKDHAHFHGCVSRGGNNCPECRCPSRRFRTRVVLGGVHRAQRPYQLMYS